MALPRKELIFDGGSITPAENLMWHLEVLGRHRGFYETRDDAIETALNLLCKRREFTEADGLLIVSRDSMEEALEITEKLCDLSDSAEDGSGLKSIEDELNKLYKLLENMNSYQGG
jgi:hypothetical protein